MIMETELEKMKMELAALRAEADAKAEAEAAEARRLVELQAAIEAEEKRKNSKEYKAALRSIDEMAKQAEAQKQSVYKTADVLMDEIKAWGEILKKRQALARQHRIVINDLSRAEGSVMGNIYQLNKNLVEWKKTIEWRRVLKKKRW